MAQQQVVRVCHYGNSGGRKTSHIPLALQLEILSKKSLYLVYFESQKLSESL
jgi:hypothetical protein